VAGGGEDTVLALLQHNAFSQDSRLKAKRSRLGQHSHTNAPVVDVYNDICEEYSYQHKLRSIAI